MTTSDVLDLVSEMKQLGVAYFKHGDLEVAFKDVEPATYSRPLFSDQAEMLRELSDDKIDPDGKPVVVGYTDEDLFGSSA